MRPNFLLTAKITQQNDSQRQIRRNNNNNLSLDRSSAQFKCIGNNNISLFCRDTKCKQPSPFSCGDTDYCKCHLKHKMCITGKLNFTIQKLNEKVNKDIDKIKKQVSQIFELMIDHLIKFKNNALIEIDNCVKFIHFTEEQKQFYHVFVSKKQSLENLTSAKLAKVWENIDRKLVEEDKIFWDNYKSQITSFSQFVISQTDKLEQNLKNIEIQRKNYFQKATKSIENSSIIKNYQDLINLVNFFDQKIKKTTLVYKASLNNFQINKFHEKCDGLKNTVTLVETEFGKVIGGYTPLPWHKQGRYSVDESMSSFLFSVTNNHKMKLKNKQYAIYGHLNYGPTFGAGHDLYVCHLADKNIPSYANLGHSYVHSDYDYNKQQCWSKFSGATTSRNFKVKEWQVYEVKFE